MFNKTKMEGVLEVIYFAGRQIKQYNVMRLPKIFAIWMIKSNNSGGSNDIIVNVF